VRRLIRASPRSGALIRRGSGPVVAPVAVAVLVLAGCGAGGVRNEGPAQTDSSLGMGSSAAQDGSPTPSPSVSPEGPKIDVMALIKHDPKVSAALKARLKPCPTMQKAPHSTARHGSGPSDSPDTDPGVSPGADPDTDTDKSRTQAPGGYPVDMAYGRLTGAKTPDVVVNVMSCSDGFGVGSYVYRKVGKEYQDVFADEQSPVYADVAGDELRVTTLVFAPGDVVCCPTGEDMAVYRWSQSRRSFAVTDRTHTDYGKTASDDVPDVPPPTRGP
jgi:hypothetical protein